jgi:hypothetical protein
VSERTTGMDFPGGDWAIISIDGAITRAKIVHKSRELFPTMYIDILAFLLI